MLRRLSRHIDTSLDATHPPTGLRAGMLERRPARAAAVTPDPSDSGRIDTELAPFAGRVRRVPAEAHLH